VTDDFAGAHLPATQAARSIRSIRGLRVILDSDLAHLYGVLGKAVDARPRSLTDLAQLDN
jgi:hypothetical protein